MAHGPARHVLISDGDVMKHINFVAADREISPAAAARLLIESGAKRLRELAERLQEASGGQ